MTQPEPTQTRHTVDDDLAWTREQLLAAQQEATDAVTRAEKAERAVDHLADRYRGAEAARDTWAAEAATQNLRAERAEAERDRYRFCWNSARDRAQALGEGVLRHVANRDPWKRQALEQQQRAERAEAALDAVRAVLADWEGSDISYSNFASAIRAAIDAHTTGPTTT
ncbi:MULTISPECIES: hypothetical protein [Streptomyces]|uniref:Uncharacterized protein n=2 Tax=Streptomyces venezuelae TaxID=54571 RepID=F2RL01_STRVP|nr:hypothetical protein [Streptomyces venezuelae]APE21370.1 hypothetical protein vnz_10285 [Streptomyces venezuelae]QER98759.1 hypothetical protein DEJ43_10415 [Streptomyces venezuelae ATCC 10712]CCA55390.1 hypothetical protein SVEN_2104 [Streptomyces venezuelae ATCC 10712]